MRLLIGVVRAADHGAHGGVREAHLVGLLLEHLAEAAAALDLAVRITRQIAERAPQRA